MILCICQISKFWGPSQCVGTESTIGETGTFWTGKFLAWNFNCVGNGLLRDMTIFLLVSFGNGTIPSSSKILLALFQEPLANSGRPELSKLPIRSAGSISLISSCKQEKGIQELHNFSSSSIWIDVRFQLYLFNINNAYRKNEKC